MLTLPARLRTHKVGGPQDTTRSPAAKAIRAVMPRAHSDRAAAISCQSHQGPSACVSDAIRANSRLACSIHRYGLTCSSRTAPPRRRGGGERPRPLALYVNGAAAEVAPAENRPLQSPSIRLQSASACPTPNPMRETSMRPVVLSCSLVGLGVLLAVFP